MNNKTLVLLKAGIVNQFSFRRYRTISGARKLFSSLAVLLVIALYVGFTASLGFVYYEIGKTISAQGEGSHLVLIIAYIEASLLCTLVSITQASSHLFDFKDYDMLSSLPVKNSSILVSKIVMLYVTNMLINTAVCIPAIVAFGILTKSGFFYYVLGFIMYLFLPFLPMSIGAFISFIWVIYLEKYRFANLILSVLIIAGIVAVVFLNVFFAAGADSVEDLLVSINNLSRKFYPAILFAIALSETNIKCCVLILGPYIVLFGSFILCFASVFRAINSSLTEEDDGANFKMIKLNTSPHIKSLFMKEAKFYSSSFIYVVNTLISIMIPTAATIILIFTGTERFNIPRHLIMPILFCSSSVCISLTPITASSISLESKNLWILKSMPVRFSRIAVAKIGFSAIITSFILLFDCTLLSLHFKLAVSEFSALAALIILDSIFIAGIGLIINLLFPKLIWTSHVQVVKQSMSVIISTMTGIVISAGFGAIYYFLNDKSFYVPMCIFILVIGNVLLGFFLITKGKRIFYNLNE